MKQAVSVSLGSSSGDFVREITLAGQTVRLTREGTNGDMERARRRLGELDGTVDALGLGGIDISLSVGGERFLIGDGVRLAEAAVKTPIVDGSGLKNTLERRVVRELAASGKIAPSVHASLWSVRWTASAWRMPLWRWAAPASSAI